MGPESLDKSRLNQLGVAENGVCLQRSKRKRPRDTSCHFPNMMDPKFTLLAPLHYFARGTVLGYALIGFEGRARNVFSPAAVYGYNIYQRCLAKAAHTQNEVCIPVPPREM